MSDAGGGLTKGSWSEWIFRDPPLPVATVFAAILYGLGHWQLAQFYGKLGTSPEEVGFGPVSVIVRLGPVAVAVIAIPVIAAHGLLSRLPISAKERLLIRVLVWGIVFILPVLAIVFHAKNELQTRLDDVRSGYNTRPGIIWPVRAQCVETAWMETPSEEAQTRLAESDHAMLLGSSEGQLVFLKTGGEGSDTYPQYIREIVRINHESIVTKAPPPEYQRHVEMQEVACHELN